MHIIFEEHRYKAEDVKDVLKDIGAMQDVDKNVNVSYVGYFYSETVRDCVFILPKVLLEDKVVDDKTIEVLAGIKPRNKEDDTKEYITPEDIISPDGQEKYLPDDYRKFIYEFAVWIFRALSVYRQKNTDSHAIYYKQLPQSGRGKRHQANTFLDILLSLIRFNKENQDFFMFTIRNMHSGLNKINWTKTIAKSQEFIHDGTPIYIDPINKKRKINYDEELFIIFFSILNHINDKYGFRAPINFEYELINKKRFKHYLDGYGQLRLRQIRYKYFSDKALMLWDLCYAFFESAHKLAVNTDQKEYLLAKKFEIVFEAMIDELIGDRDIPRGLKKQYDDKRVDHMYRYDALIRDDNEPTDEQIYYIGDSKYYKSGHKLGRTSIYKQFTYARNVIQWNIDLFLDKEIAIRDMNEEEKVDYTYDTSNDSGYKKIQLRKKNENFSTEGYNVIPNFFISAFVYPDRKYVATENIKPSTDKARPHTHISFQFENRLFDRDTLILSHYDVNFLYVLYLYARNKQAEKNRWKDNVHVIFRDEIRKVLEEKFDFYAMKAFHEDDAIEYLRSHFQDVNGKLYTPYGVDDIYSLALKHENDENSKVFKENQALLDELKKYFAIVRLAKTTDSIGKLKLGDNPEPYLREAVAAEREQRVNSYVQPQWLTEHHLERYPDNGVAIGFYRDKEHLRWILGNNNRGTLIYNVRAYRAKEGEDIIRDGAHTEHFYNKQKTKFVILYTDGYKQTGEYRVFHVKDHAYLRKEDVLETGYPTKDPTGQAESDYYLYRFDEEVSIGKIDIVRLIEKLSRKAVDTEEGKAPEQPLFTTCKELIPYRNP